METVDFIITSTDSATHVCGHSCDRMVTPGAVFTVVGTVLLEPGSPVCATEFKEMAAIHLTVAEIQVYGAPVPELEPGWPAALVLEGDGLASIGAALEQASEDRPLCMRSLTLPAPA